MKGQYTTHLSATNPCLGFGGHAGRVEYITIGEAIYAAPALEGDENLPTMEQFKQILRDTVEAWGEG